MNRRPSMALTRKVDPLCAQLRRARVNREMTQQQVADQMGTQQSSVSDWEGGVSDPNLRSLIRWADVFGFDVVLRLRAQ